ncbi:hypothetical protein LCGC14_1020970 [marine sediment metagenome]|uniref:Uncharacterized protein n=1 Tax=marine sediment metagenome TaxID=412755 RepID=A0A0F9N1Y3_9ZZZZ
MNPEMKTYTGLNTGAGPQEVTVTLVKVVPGDKTRAQMKTYKLSHKPSLALWNHSPVGFQWGYGGSGPAQLALAILLDFTNAQELSVRLHQKFKAAFITRSGKKLLVTEPEMKYWISMVEQGAKEGDVK